jgi:sigma54-dependent transcription regulator
LLDEFGLAQARSLAGDWNVGFGHMYDLALTGNIACRSGLLEEIDGCLADLAEVGSTFPDDDIIIGEMVQLKRFRAWAEENPDGCGMPNQRM